ncbi:hypothetical protein ACIA8K_01470 [Catenuloplanes sp. NPDC051500]|uniref:hypothetical protein n=1 Tax=Catenuloplanes sp. NPDC051500 TaxID=3363959 RepID=UPI0037970093
MTSDRTNGLVQMTRTVCSVAADLAQNVERAVVGPARVRTASGNAWEAVCADRDRARKRDEMLSSWSSLRSSGLGATTKEVGVRQTKSV